MDIIIRFCPCKQFLPPPACLLKVQNACFYKSYNRTSRPAMQAAFQTCYFISEVEEGVAVRLLPPSKWVTPCRSAAKKDASVRLFETAIRHLWNPAHLSSCVVITHMKRMPGDDKEGPFFFPSPDSQSVFFLNDSRGEECFPTANSRRFVQGRR